MVKGVRHPVQFAVVTNNPLERAMAALRAARKGAESTHIDKLLNLIGPNWFEAGEVQKPKPDVYLRAMKQLGISTEACFAIEDSITGVKAARAAGILTLGYTGISSVDLTPAGAFACFKDWKAFLTLLE